MNESFAARAAGVDPAVVDPAALDSVAGIRGDDGLELAPALPGDHPAWQRDVLSVSARARAIVAALRPVALKVLSFWDHRIREAVFGGRTLTIGPCGSYRVR